MAKLHWSEGKQDDELMYLSLCGRLSPERAAAPADVTCGLCKRKLLDFAPSIDADEYVNAVYRKAKPIVFAPPQPLLDPESSMPIVSRFTWETVRQSSSSFEPAVRRHWCGHCAVCVWFAELEADANARPWKKVHRLAPDSGFRWRSVTHAIEWWVNVRLSGYAVGTLGEALDKIGRLGTVIRSSSGGGQKAYEQAEDVASFEKVLDECCRKPSERGLTRQERLLLLIATTVTTEPPHRIARSMRGIHEGLRLTGPQAVGIARADRDDLYLGLRERAMVPPR